MACEHVPLHIPVQTCLGPKSARSLILYLSSNLFPCSFHLWGPSSVPSDLTEHDCPLFPMTASQRSQDREHTYSSLLQDKTASFTLSRAV